MLGLVLRDEIVEQKPVSEPYLDRLISAWAKPVNDKIVIILGICPVAPPHVVLRQHPAERGRGEQHGRCRGVSERHGTSPTSLKELLELCLFVGRLLHHSRLELAAAHEPS